MRKYIITEEQLKKISYYQNIVEGVEGFDPKKVKIIKGTLYYNNLPYRIYTAGKERFFEYFNFDGNTLKMKFTDGKPQEYSIDNWLWGGKIKDIIGGLVGGLKEISVAAGQLLLKRLS